MREVRQEQLPLRGIKSPIRTLEQALKEIAEYRAARNLEQRKPV